MPIVRFFIFGALAASLCLTAPCRAQNSAKEILSKSPAELIAILENADAPLFDKAKACQRLAIVGAQDAVPALAALLPDETLNLYARFGLEGIADPSAGAALRDAATNLKGRPLVGVINSIGRRRDAQAVELLAGLLQYEDEAVASAAAGSLGRIGTAEAAEVLQETLTKDSPIKAAVADACLAGAEGLAAAGKKDEAVALLEAVAKADVPEHLQIASLQGQFRLLQGEAKELLLAQIRAEDEARFDLGLAVAREMPGEGLTATLAEEMKNLSPARQALLLLALGDRKQPPSSSLLEQASRSASPELRDAAIRVLAKVGDESSVSILLDAALGEGDAAQSAQQGLQSLANENVDGAIVARLKEAKAQDKVVLLQLVGARRIAAAEPEVRASLDERSEAVQSAALAAFAQLIELKDMGELIERALTSEASADNAARAALRTAALRLSDREGAAAALAARLQGADDGDLQRQIVRHRDQGRRHARPGRMAQRRRRSGPAGDRPQRPGSEVPDSRPSRLSAHRPPASVVG